MTTHALSEALIPRLQRQAGAAAFVLAGLAATALALGLRAGDSATWGLGAACLLQVPPALAVVQRLRTGLGNRGLDTHLRVLRGASGLLRLLAVGLGLVAATDLLAGRGPAPTPATLGLGGLLLVGLGWVAWSRRRVAAHHPVLAQDTRQALGLLAGAGLQVVGGVASAWVPWAGPAAALLMALGLFGVAQALGASLTVQARGCGGGCSCG